jgi:hypothetical protein
MPPFVADFLLVKVFKRAHILLLVGWLVVPHGISATESLIERRFADERKSLTCFEGPTNEPSCSGTGMAVYLRGDEIQCLDWTVEMSTKFIREQYYFRGSVPVLVIETIHAKLDAEANQLKKPKLLSVMRYRLDDAGHTKRRKGFLEHAEFLIREFHDHRSRLTPCSHPNI